MSVVLAKDHKASSASPLPCIMKASISTTLGRSFIYIAQRKTIFWKTNINHGQYSKSQCFHSKTQSNVFILAKEQVSDSENNTVLHTKETQKGFSGTVPLNLLHLYKKSWVLTPLTVFNGSWSQWDSLHDTYSYLPGPCQQTSEKNIFFTLLSNRFMLMHIWGWANSWGIYGDTAGVCVLPHGLSRAPAPLGQGSGRKSPSFSEYKGAFEVWVAFVVGFGEQRASSFSCSVRREDTWIYFGYLFC